MIAFTSFLHVLSLMTLVRLSFQWVNKPDDHYFFSKPMVVPSSERELHSVYIEFDTLSRGSKTTPYMALIYLGVIDGQLTFGGHPSDLPSYMFPNKQTNCAMFYNENVNNFCDDEYFLLRTDMINLVKIFVSNSTDFNTICVGKNTDYNDKNRFVMKYGNRVLMMYKKDINTPKCIGTYDIAENTFTCLIPDKKQKKMVPFVDNEFLHDPFTGGFIRAERTVEIYCRERFIFPKIGT